MFKYSVNLLEKNSSIFVIIIFIIFYIKDFFFFFNLHIYYINYYLYLKGGSIINNVFLNVKKDQVTNYLYIFILNKFYNKIFNFNLKFYIKYFLNINAILNIFLIENNTISSRLLFEYICKNLQKNLPINRIISSILIDLQEQVGLLGYKILTSGRFTRNERALYDWITHGGVPLSLKKSYLDFYKGIFKSRFGICSIKIWIFKK